MIYDMLEALQKKWKRSILDKRKRIVRDIKEFTVILASIIPWGKILLCFFCLIIFPIAATNDHHFIAVVLGITALCLFFRLAGELIGIGIAALRRLAGILWDILLLAVMLVIFASVSVIAPCIKYLLSFFIKEPTEAEKFKKKLTRIMEESKGDYTKEIIDRIIVDMDPWKEYNNKTRNDIASVLSDAFPESWHDVVMEVTDTINSRIANLPESVGKNGNAMNQSISALQEKKQNPDE